MRLAYDAIILRQPLRSHIYSKPVTLFNRRQFPNYSQAEICSRMKPAEFERVKEIRSKMSTSSVSSASSRKSQIPLSFATCSLTAHSEEDTLNKKLKAIAMAGFQGIELAFPDLLEYTNQLFNTDKKSPVEIRPDDYTSLCVAAKNVGRMCSSLGLKVLMLQPFSNLEGWPRGSKERDEAFHRAKNWIRIMEACGTDMLQVRRTSLTA